MNEKVITDTFDTSEVHKPDESLGVIDFEDEDEMMESNAELEDKLDWLLRNDENMGYGNG